MFLYLLLFFLIPNSLAIFVFTFILPSPVRSLRICPLTVLGPFPVIKDNLFKI